MLKNIAYSVKGKRLFRSISFFRRNRDGNDMNSCTDRKPSKLLEKSSLEGCCPLPKVIIIGAGLSGMSAASRLVQEGVKDVLVIEATDRIGGRIQSVWVADTMIEFGASVLYGASMANPVFNLANIAGALPNPLKRLANCKKVFLCSDGSVITDYGVESLLFQQLIADAASKKPVRPPGCQNIPKQNLIQYLGLRVQQELLHFPSKNQHNAEKVLWGMINSLRAAHGAEPSIISVDALSKRTHTPGGAVSLDGGMHRILAPLIKQIPEEGIILNSPVHSVTVGGPSEDNSVSVTTCDGKIFEANYVIVTIPVGVLRKQGNKMFNGALTQEQLSAINNIGIGKKNNIYLEYATPWWIPGITGMSLAWGMDELHKSTEWTKGIAYIHEVSKSKHLLSIEIAGSEAELIETVCIEEVAVQVTKFLRKFTGNISIPFPNNIYISRWNTDPYFQGSNIFYGMNTTTGMIKDLGGVPCSTNAGTPVHPLIFAGDGTIPEYFGTMEGARRSGISAANKIITSTKIKCEQERKQEDPCDLVDIEDEGEQEAVQKC